MRLADVRRFIARTVLGAVGDVPATLGEVTLRPHQRTAARRLRELLDRHGGALLADPVGMGKTYTALAVAALDQEVLIVAPAALREMWRGALAVTGITAEIVSHESLSRGVRPLAGATLVIVDEAHRARNAATHRYATLADLCRHARVLLVSATPLQNARADLAAQLALFLGRRAWAASEEELASYVVRDAVEPSDDLPRQIGPVRVDLGLDDTCVDEIIALPPPVAARGETVAGTLLIFGLVHQWASSQGALVSALQRRRTRARALLDALTAGRMPTRSELAAWTHLGDAMQLAFPELVTADEVPDDETVRLQSAIEIHFAAVNRLLDRLRTYSNADDARATALLRLRTQHPGERIIAFCQYAETVAALWSRLRGDAGVAALSAGGARVAGGRITRREVLAQFQPSGGRPIPEIERISLLLTTDVLSEGLNLHEASVVVHLDLPWNPARLEQRVGRVRRLGSRHRAITVYAFAPPASAERALRIDVRLREKLEMARRTVGIAGQILPSFTIGCQQGVGFAEQEGAVHQRLREWLAFGDFGASGDERPVAAVRSNASGFLALIDDGAPKLLACTGGRTSTAGSSVLEALRLADSEAAHADERLLRDAEHALARWLEHSRAASAIDFTSAAAARVRRSTLARVSRVLAQAPRHRRAQIAVLADAARGIATTNLGEGAERLLTTLAKADLPDEVWLRSIAEFGELNARETPGPARTPPRVLAIILFQTE